MPVCLGVFLSAALTVLGAHYLYSDCKRAQEKARLLKRLVSRADETSPESSIVYKRRKVDQRFPHILLRIAPILKLKKLIQRAARNISVEGFIFMCLVSAGTAFFLALTIDNSVVFIIIFSTLGFFAPFLYLLYKQHRRIETIIEQLPDLVGLMVRSLRAGQSLDKALQEASSQFGKPLGPEIARIQEENAVGIPFEAAITHFQERLPPVVAIKIFCASLIIQKKTGGNLAEILENLSKTLRHRSEFKRKIKTLSAEGRISSIVLGALPFIFGWLTYVINPDYIKVLFMHSLGRKIVFFAVVLEVTGFAVMRMLTRIKV